MFARYSLLSTTEQAPEQAHGTRLVPKRSFLTTSLVILSIVNLCVLGTSIALWRAATAAGEAAVTAHAAAEVSEPAAAITPGPASHDVPVELAVVDVLPTAFVPFLWHTPWGAPNATEADVLWDNLNTAHGHVAVDHEWAAANHWQPSMDIPGKPGKGMYLLQAYHQLHCLRIVRTSYLAASRQEPPKYPMHHALHCFDALRQHIMCHADNTPLYGHGDGTAGDGQVHQCKDWNALRDYATRNTACFRDGKPGMALEDHFGVCDDGTDGLELGVVL